MCTAICYRAASNYFGRNLDLDYRYTEGIMITPRNMQIKFIHTSELNHHYAIIGIGTKINNLPLYYDAINEYGLGMAALNFTESCVMNPPIEEKINLATFEIIPYILASCKTVAEAKRMLQKTNLTNDRISYKLPAAKLHFMLSDREESIVAEPLEYGMAVYDNEPEALTNEPPFSIQIKNLVHMRADGERFWETSSELYIAEDKKALGYNEKEYVKSLGSAERFLRVSAAKNLSPKKINEYEAVNQFFHILSTVYHVDGASVTDRGYKRTQYSSCATLASLIYYCKTYSNSRIFSASLRKENLAADELTFYPLLWNEDIKKIN